MKMEEIKDLMHSIVAKSTCPVTVHSAYGPRTGTLVLKSAVAEMEQVLELVTEKVTA